MPRETEIYRSGFASLALNCVNSQAEMVNVSHNVARFLVLEDLMTARPEATNSPEKMDEIIDRI